MGKGVSIKYISKIEQLLRDGNVAEARRELERVIRKELPRSELPVIAQLAGRVGAPDLGLRLLGPYVRPTHRTVTIASAAEKSEYAWCLLGVGAVDEAGALLDSIESREYPRVDLYRGFFHAATWEYPQSIAPLKAFLRTEPKGSYQRLVGRMNLAAALVFENDYHQAKSLLAELLHETSAGRYRLLHANALELSSELFILNGKLDEAERFLIKAQENLGDRPSIYTFLLDKWSAVIAFMRGDEAAMTRWRALAQERGLCELVRDCDRFLVLKTKDEALAARLYFGSPSPAYRRRLLNELGRHVHLPEEYLWMPSGEANPRFLVDLFTGAVHEEGRQIAGLRVGHMVHRLLVLLVSDFYRPFRTATVFGKMNPGEFYNRETSPARVHEAVRALRAFFQESGLPLSVEATDAGYSLKALGPVALRFSHGDLLGRPHAPEIDALRQAFPDAHFTSTEALDFTRLPKRSLQRLLSEAVVEGILEKDGVRASTRYRFRKAG